MELRIGLGNVAQLITELAFGLVTPIGIIGPPRDVIRATTITLAPLKFLLKLEPRGPRAECFVFVKLAETTSCCVAASKRLKYASCPTRKSCNSSKANDDSQARIGSTISQKSGPKPFNT